VGIEYPDLSNFLIQDKNRVSQVLRKAKPGLHGFCPVPKLNLYLVIAAMKESSHTVSNIWRKTPSYFQHKGTISPYFSNRE